MEFALMATFDQLKTFEDWRKALDAMLDQAIDSARKGEGIGTVQSDVMAFIKASPGMCDELDLIAVKAANDLFEQEATRLIALIASRKGEIEALMKKMGLATDGLRKSESDLKFEKTIEALQLSKGIVDELTELRKDLADEEKANLDKAIAAAKTANDIQKLVKQYKITEATLKGLSTDVGTDEATLKKLRTILGRVIRGERKFLDLVKTTVGSDTAFKALEKPILKHAVV
jgi:hypothetical protein